MKNLHNESDKQLYSTERTLSKAYNKAYKDIKTKIAEMLADIDLTATKPNERLIELQKRDKLKKLSKELTALIMIANKQSAKDIDKLGRDIYQMNYNGTADEFKYKDINKSKSQQSIDEVDAFNIIALDALKDDSLLQRQIESSIITGVLTNKGTSGIARAVKHNVARQLSDSVRIATTVTTQSENKGIYDVGLKAVKNGKKIYKVWRSLHDEKTRPAHAQASGQKVLLNEPFIVGGEKLMYPGDYSLGASPGNTINCRCVIALIEEI